MYNYFKDYTYEVGQEVEVKDVGSSRWIQGSVATLNPLTVTPIGETEAYEWSLVRPRQVKKNALLIVPSSFVVVSRKFLLTFDVLAHHIERETFKNH